MWLLHHRSGCGVSPMWRMWVLPSYSFTVDKVDDVVPITVWHRTPVSGQQDDLDLTHLWSDKKDEAVSRNAHSPGCMQSGALAQACVQPDNERLVRVVQTETLQCVPRSSIHDHDTRNASQIDTVYTRTHMAAKCIRSQLPLVLNDTPEVILNKINTHSIQGFSFFVKQYYLSKYTTRCHEIACYVCNNWFYCFFQCAIIII